MVELAGRLTGRPYASAVRTFDQSRLDSHEATHGPSPSLSVICKAGTLASLMLAIGCVNLDKPDDVRMCAGSPEGCSDNPHPKQADAAPPADGQNDSSSGLADAAADAGRTDSDGRGGADRAAERIVSADAVADVETGIADQSQSFEVRDSDSGADPDLPADLLVSADLPAFSDAPGPDLATMDVPSGLDLGIDRLVSRDFGYDTSPEVSSSCVAQIVANGYQAGSAPACSACNDGNGGSLASPCMQMLDCLLPPSTSASYLYCLNSIHASSLVDNCVSALTKAGCPSGY
jgi:hypothetical protein